MTFDNGVTKVTTTEGLLGITLSDGTIQTTYTPVNNTSTEDNPIVLPVENQSFADIGMLVPATADSITLNELIGAPYNYWGDDDGDGQGANGISVSGSLSVNITDKNNQAVSRSASLEICKAPYKVVLTSTNVSLTTRYGVPNSSSFIGSSVTYYINPKSVASICYARPNLSWGTYSYAGPANIWSPTKGFLVQSTEPSTYNRNFPTTGANNLHFDLLAGGIDAATLTWPAVTRGGITATMTINPPISSPGDRGEHTFNPDGASSVRVTLTGPAATEAQINSDSPGSVDTPILPQTFEIVGYDSSHRAVVKYGFILKQWFVHHGAKRDSATNHSAWCSSLGYRFPQVKDLANSTCGEDNGFTCVGVVGGMPPSVDNYYQRNISAGLFTEWGNMGNYTSVGFVKNNGYWTSDRDGSKYFGVGSSIGNVYSFGSSLKYFGVCVYP